MFVVLVASTNGGIRNLVERALTKGEPSLLSAGDYRPYGPFRSIGQAEEFVGHIFARADVVSAVIKDIGDQELSGLTLRPIQPPFSPENSTIAGIREIIDRRDVPTATRVNMVLKFIANLE